MHMPQKTDEVNICLLPLTREGYKCVCVCVCVWWKLCSVSLTTSDSLKEAGHPLNI